MPFKPMKLKEYLKWIRKYGWYLVDGSIDKKLYRKDDSYVTQIKINHSPGNEVHADSVKKTKQFLKEAGLE